jgi:hypothetical protein
LTFRVLPLSIVAVLTMPLMGFAQEEEPRATPPAAATAAAETPEPDSAQPPRPASSQNASSETSARSSYLVPIVDIVAFDFLLNRYGKRFVDRRTFDVGVKSVRRNVTSGWVLDDDPFSIYVSDIASTEHRESENIARADAQVTVRLRHHHAASVRYLWSRRAASYPDLGNRIQSRGSVGLFYTYLGRTRFGAVEW